MIRILAIVFLSTFTKDVSGQSNYNTMEFVRLQFDVPDNYVFYFNGIAEDNKGNIWMSRNDGGGLFKYDGYHLKEYSNDIQDPSSISNNSLWAVDVDSKGRVWVSTSYGLNLYNSETDDFRSYVYDESDSTSISHSRIERVFEDSEGDIWVGTHFGLNLYDEKKDHFLSYHVDRSILFGPNFIISIEEDRFDSNVLWIGTNQGLFKFDKTEKIFEEVSTNFSPDEKIRKGLGAFHIYQDKLGRLYGASGYSNYLNRYDPGRKKWQRLYYDDSETFSSYRRAATYHMLEVSDTTFAFSTLSKIGIHNIINDQDQFFKTDNANAKRLYGSPVRELFTDHHGRLWVGSFLGVCHSKNPITSLRTKDIQPLLQLSDLKINGASKKIAKQLEQLEYFENDLELFFSVPAILDKSKLEYSYRLKGKDKRWSTPAPSNSVHYMNLEGANYTFELRYRYNNGSWSVTLTYPISIFQPFFWKKWWFKYFVIAMLGLFLTTGLLIRQNWIRKQQELKRQFQTQLAEVEMTALRAQMNPHFLFNTMNSINHFILKKDSESASNYLTKFARLVRQVLNNSKSKLVRLEDELGSLRLYIEMEQLRFQNHFEFQISTDDNVDLSKYFIPPLLIQPYIENAIWHGLMNKEDSGELSIRIGQSSEYLIITLRDNGIGRKAAAQLKSEYDTKKKSLGMSITQDRLDLINKIYGSNTKVEIIDLEEITSHTGTEVILTIPKMTESLY